MKKLTVLNLLIAVTLILGACSTSNNVVNNRLISKRKYNKGFHFNKKGNYKSAGEDIAVKEVKKNEELAQATPQQQQQHSTPTTDVDATNSVEAETIWEAPVEPVNIDVELPEDLVFELDENDADSQESIELEEAEAPTTKKDVKKALKTQKKQKRRSSGAGDAMFILAVIFAIILPPLGVGIYTNIDWLKVLIAFLLMLLGFLPGVVYALLVVFDVI